MGFHVWQMKDARLRVSDRPSEAGIKWKRHRKRDKGRDREKFA
jgi:hypothetical protein